MTDTTNYMLGRYIMIAVNNPKKYPEEPVSKASLIEEDEETGDQMTEEDEARLSALMGSFASKANALQAAKEEPETTKEKEPEDAGHK